MFGDEDFVFVLCLWTSNTYFHLTHSFREREREREKKIKWKKHHLKLHYCTIKNQNPEVVLCYRTLIMLQRAVTRTKKCRHYPFLLPTVTWFLWGKCIISIWFPIICGDGVLKYLGHNLTLCYSNSNILLASLIYQICLSVSWYRGSYLLVWLFRENHFRTSSGDKKF